ncbi:MAG: single-stranded-DNA-specific exonuclease RecJ, partial [Candidatus Omnitrophota bacterium]
MNTHTILNIPACDNPLRRLLVKELSISDALAQVLVNRGITSVEEADRFLHVKLEHLHDPFAFASMAAAVSLIKKTIEHKHPILVHGD